MAVSASARAWLAAVRPRPDWLPRSSVGLGIGATVAMNVAAGSRGGAGGALLGTLTPVGFVVSLETLIFLVRKLARVPWGWAWCLGAGLPLAGLAGITGVISYLHALTVAEWTGDPAEAGLALTEHLIPLVADLMILTGSVALVALAVARRPAPAKETTPRRERPARPPKKPDSSPRTDRHPGAVRVADLVKDLPPARLAELAAMSKRDLARELDVTPWAAEVWKRGYGKKPAVNGSK